jgi:hypothetical protein
MRQVPLRRPLSTGVEASPSPAYGARLLSGLRVTPLAGSNPAASATLTRALPNRSWRCCRPASGSQLAAPRSGDRLGLGRRCGWGTSVCPLGPGGALSARPGPRVGLGRGDDGRHRQGACAPSPRPVGADDASPTPKPALARDRWQNQPDRRQAETRRAAFARPTRAVARMQLQGACRGARRPLATGRSTNWSDRPS